MDTLFIVTMWMKITNDAMYKDTLYQFQNQKQKKRHFRPCGKAILYLCLYLVQKHCIIIRKW